MIFNNDIIAAQATPPGKSAIAVLRMSGEGVLDVLKRCLLNPGTEIEPRRATLVDIGNEDGLIDRVIVIYYQAPKSYTGEDLVEIQYHGGEIIAWKVLELLMNKGARPAQPGEFSLRAFLNGKMDLTQAEAVADLIASEGENARRNALNQLQGGLTKFVERVRGELLEVLAEVEAEIEFPEDELIEIDYNGWEEKLKEAKIDIDEMVKRGVAGKAVREGYRVTIAGPPNSGKSTLMNALLGQERAIVHPQAGTTRDTLRESMEIGGIRVWFTDTAGLRKDAGEVEKEGIERARREVENADLTIYLYDLCAGLDNEGAGEIIRKRAGGDTIVMGNKVDLCKGEDKVPALKISALKGEGLEELKAMIAQRAMGISAEGGVIANERHLEAMREASACIERAIEIAKCKGETEIMALEIREVALHIGSIIGEGVGEEVLERIFARFCIGK